MKLNYNAAFAAGMLSLMACLQLFSCTPLQSSAAGQGTVKIHLGTTNQAKTIQPSITADSYSISFSGPSTVSDQVTSDSTVSVVLTTGSWTITVQAFLSGKKVAEGSAANVAVVADATIDISILLYASMVGTGYIDVTVTWPSSLATPIASTTGTIGGIVIPENELDYNATGYSVRYNAEHASGSYPLVFNLYSGSWIFSFPYAIQVYDNLTSSETIELTIDDFTQIPNPPSSLTVLEGQGCLNVAWNDNSSIETAFILERAGLDGVWAGLPAGTLPGNTEAFTDGTASAGTVYSYRVSAQNEFGISDPCTPASASWANPSPGNSGILSLGAPTSSSIPVSWTIASDNVTNQTNLQYKLVYSASNNIGTVSTAEANGTQALAWTANASSTTVSGLIASTPYWFNILVRDDAGNVNAYTSASRTTDANPIASAMIIDHSNWDPFLVSDAEIAKAANLDVYFEHASVGGYIVGPEPSWPSNGLEDLAVLNSRYTCDRVTWSNTSTASWYDTHNGLGDNSRGNPGANQKISGFSSSINASSGLLPGKIDVAMYKFCYIDSPSDAATLFNTAKTAMVALQSAYPDIIFVWWTMPIETTSNAGRQTYNDLVRAYCGANDQWLFDIAAIESHTDAGVIQLDGSNREILYSGYSADGGHPNDTGALKLAKAYWRLIAEIAKTR